MLGLIIFSIFIGAIVAFANATGLIWALTDLPLREKVKCSLFGVIFFFIVLLVKKQEDEGYDLSKAFSLLTIAILSFILILNVNF